jgi:hypothetical protein
LVETNSELIVVEVDSLNFAVCLFTASIQAFVSCRTPGVVNACKVRNTRATSTFLAFGALDVQADVATLTGSAWVRIHLPAFFAGALKVAEAALVLFLTGAVASTLHARIGLIAVRIISALLAEATNAVLGTSVALAVIVSVTAWVTGRTAIGR